MRPNKSGNAALTLLELLVLVAIIGIVATLLFPMLARARARAQGVGCINRLKQWGLAFQMYAHDNGGWLFTTRHWESTEFLVGDNEVVNVYTRYLREATSDRIVELRNCPNVLNTASLAEFKVASKYSYSMNWPNVKTPTGYQLAMADPYGGASYRLDRIPKPAEFLLVVDSDGVHYSVKSHDLKAMVSSILGRHSGGVNVLWADQHANFVSFETITAQSALSDNENIWFQAN
jgi:prepilin-type processing-associated H-X9-DG protein